MNEKAWLSKYFDRFRKAIFESSVETNIATLKDLLLETSRNGKKVIVAGNGGSAAMASHMAVDLTKTAGIRSVNFNEADLITCFANDFGYENWVKEALKAYADEGDLVILISSSGKSPNMVNGGHFAAEQGLKLVTFTGFSSDNPLKKLGSLNFWVDSSEYNVVENTHLIWLLAACDMVIDSKKEKKQQFEVIKN